MRLHVNVYECVCVCACHHVTVSCDWPRGLVWKKRCIYRAGVQRYTGVTCAPFERSRGLRCIDAWHGEHMPPRALGEEGGMGSCSPAGLIRDWKVNYKVFSLQPYKEASLALLPLYAVAWGLTNKKASVSATLPVHAFCAPVAKAHLSAPSSSSGALLQKTAGPTLVPLAVLC